jgi:hypothetical protein
MGSGSQVPGPDAYDSEVGDEYAILTIPQAAPSLTSTSVEPVEASIDANSSKRRSVAFSIPITEGKNQPIPPTIRPVGEGGGGAKRKGGVSSASTLQTSSSTTLPLSSSLPLQGLRMVPIPNRPGEFTLEGWPSTSGPVNLVVKVENDESGQPVLIGEKKVPSLALATLASSSSSATNTTSSSSSATAALQPSPHRLVSTQSELSERSKRRLNKEVMILDSSRGFSSAGGSTMQPGEGSDGGKWWAILKNQQNLLDKIYSSSVSSSSSSSSSSSFSSSKSKVIRKKNGSKQKGTLLNDDIENDDIDKGNDNGKDGNNNDSNDSNDNYGDG